MASAVIKFLAIFMLIGVCIAQLEVEAKNDEQTVSEQCLDCICHAISGCKKGLQCNGEVCGIFGITKPFWIDAGNLTLSGQSPEDKDAYQKCTVDPQCATRTVQGYMTRFRQDCNDDGKINCRDYMAIHMRGGFGCKGDLPPKYLSDFNKCVAGWKNKE